MCMLIKNRKPKELSKCLQFKGHKEHSWKDTMQWNTQNKDITEKTYNFLLKCSHVQSYKFIFQLSYVTYFNIQLVNSAIIQTDP
jgi:hypothetical protein